MNKVVNITDTLENLLESIRIRYKSRSECHKRVKAQTTNQQHIYKRREINIMQTHYQPHRKLSFLQEKISDAELSMSF